MPWRQILRTNFTNWETLADFLQLDEGMRASILKRSSFPLNLPKRLAEKCQKGTLEDPILRQFLPDVREASEVSGFVDNPVRDAEFQKSSKCLQKYAARVLFVTTSACAMHCRYCFRQNYSYETERKEFDEEISLIREDETVEEVILSGGDPLSLSNERLKSLLLQIDAIPHVKRIRFHSRFLIGIPERVDGEFLAILSSLRCVIYFVLHVNHPRELDEEVGGALQKLRRAGVELLNQSVLLRAVNADVETLVLLSKQLVDQGVLPYYLHALDFVKGAERFLVSDEEGKALVLEMQKQLPGYAVPRFVREIPGQLSKTLL